MKFLLLALVFFVIAGWLVRGKKPLNAPRSPAHDDTPDSGKQERGNPGGLSGRQAGVEDIVQCANCQILFPASEAVTGAGGALYCSEAHKRLGNGSS